MRARPHQEEPGRGACAVCKQRSTKKACVAGVKQPRRGGALADSFTPPCTRETEGDLSHCIITGSGY